MLQALKINLATTSSKGSTIHLMKQSRFIYVLAHRPLVQALVSPSFVSLAGPKSALSEALQHGANSGSGSPKRPDSTEEAAAKSLPS